MSESERQPRALLRNSSDMITVVAPDASASVLYQTGAVRSVVGREPEELEGTNLADWVEPEDVPRLLELCQNGRVRQRGAAHATRRRQRPGLRRPRQGLLDEDAWWGAVLHTHDITEKKRLELELRLAQKLESVGQLAAGIAHEINTPLQYISSSVQFVKSSFSDLSELLQEIDARLRQAAGGGAIDPELLTRIADAKEATDLDYLCSSGHRRR